VARSLTIREHGGEYGIEVEIAGHRFGAVIDTGFTHPRCETGLCVETVLYDQFTPYLRDQQAIQAFAVGDRPHLFRSGIVKAEIVGLADSAVETRILDAGSNLVGVCFFTRLASYRVAWNPGDRTMRLWRP
jgi:hypothetical protein